MSKVKIYIKSILIPLILGSIIGFITSGSMNYSNLIKPVLSPPAILFPIVWTILYTLMGVSFGILESNNLVDRNVKIIYYSQLAINLFWPILFFTFEARLFAAIWLAILIILVALMITIFYSKNKVSGLLQIPYILWCSFALYLNIFTYILNK